MAAALGLQAVLARSTRWLNCRSLCATRPAWCAGDGYPRCLGERLRAGCWDCSGGWRGGRARYLSVHGICFCGSFRGFTLGAVDARTCLSSCLARGFMGFIFVGWLEQAFCDQLFHLGEDLLEVGYSFCQGLGRLSKDQKLLLRESVREVGQVACCL
eukprot:4927998-Amphidinium_carterae.2